MTNRAHFAPSFDHLADHERGVVMVDRITRYQSVLAWLVHGDDKQAMHMANLMTDEELAAASIAAQRLASLCQQVADARRAVGDEIGAIVVGAGRGRVRAL